MNKPIKSSVILLLMVIFTCTATIAYAQGWHFVETITIDGYQNSIPEGTAVQRNYSAGNYLFVLSTSTKGISYNKNKGYPYVRSCFIIALEDSTTTGAYHSIGLSEKYGPMKAQLTSAANTIGVRFFIMDWNRSDNDGSVLVKVYRWS